MDAAAQRLKIPLPASAACSQDELRKPFPSDEASNFADALAGLESPAIGNFTCMTLLG